MTWGQWFGLRYIFLQSFLQTTIYVVSAVRGCMQSPPKKLGLNQSTGCFRFKRWNISEIIRPLVSGTHTRAAPISNSLLVLFIPEVSPNSLSVVRIFGETRF